jgi:hypothetical protein
MTEVLDLRLAHLKICLQASEIRSSKCMYGHKIRQTGFVLIFSPTFFVLAQNLAKAKFRKKKLFKQIISYFSLARIWFYLSRPSVKWVSAKTVIV